MSELPGYYRIHCPLVSRTGSRFTPEPLPGYLRIHRPGVSRISGRMFPDCVPGWYRIAWPGGIGILTAIAISYGDNPNAAIVLNTGTAIREFAEVKCPKIDRSRHLNPDAELQTLPGMDTNTIPFVYNHFVNLNLTIDVFLKEAEAFVLSRPKREPTLFDESNEDDNG
jgi:hypothetical protein